MSEQERQIQTPGEAPAAPAAAEQTRRKPGPKSKAEREAEAAAAATTATAGAADDLAEFDSEELPEAPAAPSFTPEQQALITKMIADAVRASKSSQDPATAAKLAAQANGAERLPTQDDARVMCENAVAQGKRPRPILTIDGWYAHPEMARSKDTGVTLLGG